MSMTIKEAVQRTDALCKLNAYDNETKTFWLEQLDQRIQSELWRWSPEDAVRYDWDSCQDHALLAEAPYDRMYLYWLAANIALADGEHSAYQNYFAIFDSAWKEYARWLTRERGGVLL